MRQILKTEWGQGSQNQRGTCSGSSEHNQLAFAAFVHSWLHFKRRDKVNVVHALLPWPVPGQWVLWLPRICQMAHQGTAEMSGGLGLIPIPAAGVGSCRCSLWWPTPLTHILFLYLRLWGVDWESGWEESFWGADGTGSSESQGGSTGTEL